MTEKKPPDSNSFVLALTAIIMVVIVVLAVLSYMRGSNPKENLYEFQRASPTSETASDDAQSVSQRIRSIRSILGAIVG